MLSVDTAAGDCYNGIANDGSWTGLGNDFTSADGNTDIQILGRFNNEVTVPNGTYSFSDYVTLENSYYNNGSNYSNLPATMFLCSFTSDDGTTGYGMTSGSITVNNDIVGVYYVELKSGSDIAKKN